MAILPFTIGAFSQEDQLTIKKLNSEAEKEFAQIQKHYEDKNVVNPITTPDYSKSLTNSLRFVTVKNDRERTYVTGLSPEQKIEHKKMQNREYQRRWRQKQADAKKLNTIDLSGIENLSFDARMNVEHWRKIAQQVYEEQQAELEDMRKMHELKNRDIKRMIEKLIREFQEK